VKHELTDVKHELTDVTHELTGVTHELTGVTGAVWGWRAGGHGGAADNKQQAFMTTLAYNFLWKVIGGDSSKL
jgi:hypothetical protein